MRWDYQINPIMPIPNPAPAPVQPNPPHARVPRGRGRRRVQAAALIPAAPPIQPIQPLQGAAAFQALPNSQPLVHNQLLPPPPRLPAAVGVPQAAVPGFGFPFNAQANVNLNPNPVPVQNVHCGISCIYQGRRIVCKKRGNICQRAHMDYLIARRLNQARSIPENKAAHATTKIESLESRS